jgi:hypothetical protein
MGVVFIIKVTRLHGKPAEEKAAEKAAAPVVTVHHQLTNRTRLYHTHQPHKTLP